MNARHGLRIGHARTKSGGPVVAARLPNVLARGERRSRPPPWRSRAVGPGPHRFSEALPEVAAVRRDRTEEHHGAHVLRVRDRVRRGEEWSVRMRDENDAIDLEVASNGVEVVDLRGGRENRRIARQRRAAGAALVVKDHDMLFGERCEVAIDALEIDTGANGR